MQVLPCNGVHYAGESNSPNQGSEKAFVYDGEANNVKHELVQDGNDKLDNMETSDDEQFGEFDEGRHGNDPFHEVGMSSNSRDSGVDSLDVDMVGRELPVGNQECESSRLESEWLEEDQPMGVWVKASVITFIS